MLDEQRQKKTVLKNGFLSGQEKRIKTAYLLSSRFFVGFLHYDEIYLTLSKSHQTQQPPFSYGVGFDGTINGLAGVDMTE